MALAYRLGGGILEDDADSRVIRPNIFALPSCPTYMRVWITTPVVNFLVGVPDRVVFAPRRFTRRVELEVARRISTMGAGLSSFSGLAGTAGGPRRYEEEEGGRCGMVRGCRHQEVLVCSDTRLEKRGRARTMAWGRSLTTSSSSNVSCSSMKPVARHRIEVVGLDAEAATPHHHHPARFLLRPSRNFAIWDFAMRTGTCHQWRFSATSCRRSAAARWRRLAWKNSWGWRSRKLRTPGRRGGARLPCMYSLSAIQRRPAPPASVYCGVVKSDEAAVSVDGVEHWARRRHDESCCGRRFRGRARAGGA